MNEITLVGVYASGRAAADAAAAIRRAGLGEVETVSPTADHDVTGTPIRRRGTTG